MLTRKTRHVLRGMTSVSMIVMLLVSGCADKYGRIPGPANDRTEISATHTEFSNLANSSDLPSEYVSEGKIGVSQVEAALEEADSLDIQARAELNKRLADNSARRSEISARANQNLTETNALREKYSKEYTKAIAEIKAREAELEALESSKDAVINSMAKEAESKRNDILAQGREKFESETARIEQLRDIYNAIEVESNAKILEMKESSKAIRERAAATVQDLEAEAAAVQLETNARTDELEEQINSTKVQTKSEVERLTATRDAILRTATAQVKELRAKSDTIQANLATEEYQLKLSEAESTKAEAQAKTQEKSAVAPTRLDKAIAEIESLRAEIIHQQDTAAAAYGSQLAEVQAKLSDELNEIKKIRISADRAEQVARAEFVKAEAAARAEAVRQTAVHAEAVAEAQRLQIIADAEAEASRIKQEVMEEIAIKKEASKVEMKNHTREIDQQPEGLHEVPAVPQVQAVAPRIEPDHIAAFRSSFADVMRARAKADARELVAQATFAEAKTNLLAIKTQEDAIASEQLAIADVLEAQARSRFSEMEIKTAKEMDVVESQYRQHLVQAESFRKEKEAEVLDYRSQADTLEQIANARAEQLLAESEAVETSGKNDVTEMEVALWAVKHRGDAEYSKLMTEAKTIADSQEALAMQIDAQVDAACRSLEAELAKIENSITAAERIAQADYQESLTQATVLAQKTEAEINRINSQFKMEHAITKAQIARDKELALSQSLRGEAACDRKVAEITTDKMKQFAGIDAKNATAEADMNIVLASNTAKRDAAKVYLDAVKARFNARIQQVNADRVVSQADQNNKLAMRRTDLTAALAKARAAREDSSRKLAELQKRQSQLQKASLTNWSETLAKFDLDSMELLEDNSAAEDTGTQYTWGFEEAD